MGDQPPSSRRPRDRNAPSAIGLDFPGRTIGFRAVPAARRFILSLGAGPSLRRHRSLTIAETRTAPGGARWSHLDRFRPILEPKHKTQRFFLRSYSRRGHARQRKTPRPRRRRGSPQRARRSPPACLLGHCRGVSDLSLTNVRTAPAGYTEAVCCSLLRSRPTGVRDCRSRPPSSWTTFQMYLAPVDRRDRNFF
jgi:hypothetical protein